MSRRRGPACDGRSRRQARGPKLNDQKEGLSAVDENVQSPLRRHQRLREVKRCRLPPSGWS